MVYTTFGTYQTHMKKYHHLAFNCNECEKRFTMPHALKTHRVNYHINFPASCEECGEYCENRPQYLSHLEAKHNHTLNIKSQKTSFTCEICGKVFNSRPQLKTHNDVVHENKNCSFPCDVCGKVFREGFNKKRKEISFNSTLTSYLLMGG